MGVGSSSGSKPANFHASNRRRVDLSFPAAAAAPEPARAFSDVEVGAYNDACVFRDGSSTFRFRGSSAYEVVDIMDFIARALRNRARSDNTLLRVTKLLVEFRASATAPDPPFPSYGDEALIAATKWFAHVRSQEVCVKGVWRLIRACFPIDHPVELQAAVISCHKAVSAPCVDIKFLLALDEKG